MNLNERMKEIVGVFSKIESWEDRYKKLIELGKALPILDENHKIESNKVKGCQSQVWLVSKVDEGKIFFEADSDASIVKGIVALLLKVYSGSTTDEILNTPPAFLQEIGLREHLSPSRANGLNSMLKQMMMYAYAYKLKASSQG
jgi:cysteine desulfuration protein SufE